MGFPQPFPNDHDDVVWALETARVQWDRGARADAIVWIRRAADSADQCGAPGRAIQLRQSAEGLMEHLWSDAPLPPDDALPQAKPASAIPVMVDDDDDDDDDFDAFDDRAEVFMLESKSSPPPGRVPSGQAWHPGGANDEGFSSLEEIDGSSLESIPPPAVQEPEDLDADLEDDFDDQAPTEHASQADVAAAASDLSGAFEAASGEDLDGDLPPPVPTGGVSLEAIDIDPVDRSSVPELVVGALEDTDAFLREAGLIDEDSPPQRSSDPTTELFDDDAEGNAATIPPTAQMIPSLQAATEQHDAGQSGEKTQDSQAAEGKAPPERSAAAAGVSIDAEGSVDDPSTLTDPVVGDVSLLDVPGFQDLPDDAQLHLARTAKYERLGVDEEVAFFGAALVLNGEVSIMPAIEDIAGALAKSGDVVFTQGSLQQGIALRVVAKTADTEVAVWPREQLEQQLRDCPWVADEFRRIADRYQALCGIVLGPLGERLDDSLRDMVTSRLQAVALKPGEMIVAQGQAIPGLHLLGAGEIEVLDETGAVQHTLGLGEFLFGSEEMSANPAPRSARAGSHGAVVLYGQRQLAHELLTSVPPLIEVLTS